MHAHRLELLNALRAGTPLTAEVRECAPERPAWVTTYPSRMAEDATAKREGWKWSSEERSFTLQHREYSREHIMHDWDTMEGDGMWQVARREVSSEAELEQLLSDWAVPLASLLYLWRSDNPE